MTDVFRRLQSNSCLVIRLGESYSNPLNSRVPVFLMTGVPLPEDTTLHAFNGKRQFAGNRLYGWPLALVLVACDL